MIKVLIQSDKMGLAPCTIDCSIAYHGFEELEEPEARITLRKEWFSLNQEELSQYDVCVGSVNFCQSALFKLGAKGYDRLCYPSKLNRFLHRKIIKTTLKDLIAKKPQNKFVKPVRPKRCNSFMSNTLKDQSVMLMHLDENEQFYVSDLIDFESEWRVYVKKNVIQAVCFYKGDPTIFPDAKTIRRMISSWDGPCCYALDVGIARNMTCLVEINDFYSIGNYGLYHTIYAEMLLLRWRELVDANSDNDGNK